MSFQDIGLLPADEVAKATAGCAIGLFCNPQNKIQLTADSDLRIQKLRPWLQVWSERGCLSSWEAWQSPLNRNISTLRNKLCNVRWATVSVGSPNTVLYPVSEHPYWHQTDVWAQVWFLLDC